MSTDEITPGPLREVNFNAGPEGVPPAHIRAMETHCPQLQMLTSSDAAIVNITCALQGRHRPGSTPVTLIPYVPWTIEPPRPIETSDQNLLDTDVDPKFTDSVVLIYAVTADNEYLDLPHGHSLLYGICDYTGDLDEIICIVVVTVQREPRLDKNGKVKITTLTTSNGLIQDWYTKGEQQAAADFGLEPEEG